MGYDERPFNPMNESEQCSACNSHPDWLEIIEDIFQCQNFGQTKWKVIRHDVHSGLRQFVPKKEAGERIVRRNREFVLHGLYGAMRSAKIHHYPHIASELTRLIEEVKG